MHNPWFANHVYGLSGAQLRKVQLVSPQHRKIASDLSHVPFDHTNHVYSRKMTGWVPANGTRHPRKFYGNDPRLGYKPTTCGNIYHTPLE
jgi:hypothetical protein